MAVDLQLKMLKEHSRKEIFFCLAHAPGSSRIFAGASDGNVYEVDPLAEKPDFRPLAGHTSFVTGVAIAGDLLISGGYDCRMLWRKLDGGQVVRAVDNAHSRWIRKVVAAPDGRLIASVADDMVCRLWEAPTGKLLVELRGHDEQTPHHFPSMLYTCAFSADGKRLATADKTGRICLWDVTTGALLKQLDGSGFYTWDPRQRIHSIGGTRALVFTPDGKSLLAGGIGAIGNIDHLDGQARVEVFALESGQSTHVFSGDAKGLVEQLVFHPEGKWLLGVGGDNAGFWQAYDLEQKKLIKSEKAPMHVHAAALNDDATQLLAVGHGRILVWQVEDVVQGE